MRSRPVGDRAFLVEVGDPAAARRLQAWIRTRDLDVADTVVGATTLLVRAGHDADVAALRRRVVDADPDDVPIPSPRTLTVAVRYDGADLDEVAWALGLTTGEVVARHTDRDWVCAFAGFAPGFAYLESDLDWVVPRLATPRTRVPAGSVAVAAGWCGIYPRPSPGGWQLLGTTDVTLFDHTRERPAMIAPGDVVRFEAAS